MTRCDAYVTNASAPPLLDLFLTSTTTILLRNCSMPPYDDWNKIDEQDEEEVQDTSVSCSMLQSCVHSHADIVP
jgi:hypothetical protein